jgi:anti-anti-sigma regulatory factor
MGKITEEGQTPSLGQNPEGAKNGLSYFLAIQKEVCIISFVGAMDKHSVSKLEQCFEEIKTSNCHFFMFNFREISEVNIAVHRLLVMGLKHIRDEQLGKIRICGLKPNFKTQLVDIGIFKGNEVCNNVKDALESFKLIG